MKYRRCYAPGHSYFFTVNLFNRQGALLTEHIDHLRAAIKLVKERHPFSIDAIVVLPDHLHTIWTLPTNDSRYPIRWKLIKSHFSRQISTMDESSTQSRINKQERAIWQRRYWEHLIRDEADFDTHLQYIHNNPIKHGYVSEATDWPYSSIHRYHRK